MEPAPKRYADLHSAKLIELALSNEEGYLSDSGAFCTSSNEHSQPAPEDRYIVEECSTSDLIDWEAQNHPFDTDSFDQLWAKVKDHSLENDHYVSHLEVGDHPDYYLPIEITTQTAWHTLFARNIFVRPKEFNPKGKRKWRVLHAANFICDPETDKTNSKSAVIIHLAKRKVLIVGTHQAEEIKTALFAVQSFLLPEKDVLPLHCSATVGEQGDVSILVGLSGTGKTTLSMDPSRQILGDDEHGWGKETIFNFEAGCYTKTTSLNKEQTPQACEAIRFGSIVENVPHNAYTHTADFSDTRLGINGSCCFPLSHIKNRVKPARADGVKTLILLCCDATGTIPLVSRLSPEAATYHFLSGYTSSTRIDPNSANPIVDPIFSPCFAAPHLTRPAVTYAKLLHKRLNDSDTAIYMINTGWYGDQGGVNGSGSRIKLSSIREILRAIQSGELDQAPYEHLTTLNLSIPTMIPNSTLDSQLLKPQNLWSNRADYTEQARRLSHQFADNIARYQLHDEIIRAGPTLDI